MAQPIALNCLWIGPVLGPIETVCLLSMLRQGHRVRLFTYEPVANVPAGVDVVSAEEVVSRVEILQHRRRQSFALGSDIFRYRLQEAGLGPWVDLDVLVLRPITLDGPYLFGWEHPERINGAVLYLDRESPLLQALLTFIADPWPIPPFYSWAARFGLMVRRRVGFPKHVSAMRWGVFGPAALTHFAAQHRVSAAARPIDVFYPVPVREAHGPFTAQWDTHRYLTSRTVTLHLWNEMLKRPSHLRRVMPGEPVAVETGSFLADYAKRELGFRFGAPSSVVPASRA